MKYQRLEDLRTDHDLTIRQVADYLGCIRSVWIIWSASAMRSGRMDPDFPVSPPQQKQEDSFSFPCPPCFAFSFTDSADIPSSAFR